MKTTCAILVVFFSLWMKADAAQTSGLLIYTDYPSNYVEACEYTKLDVGPAYSTILRIDGQDLQIEHGGLWIALDYPRAGQSDGPASAKDLATANLATIQKLLPQYPQFKAQLTATQTKWQQALATATQLAKATPPPKSGPKEGEISFVTKDGTHYDNVTITSADAQGLTFSTDAGVEHLSFEVLPKNLQEQFHYDAMKAALQRDAEWTDNYAAAVERAKAADKLILINFTGSDWCPWCKKMKAETLDQQAFKDYAAQHLVLVELDFPHTIPQTASLKAQNETLKDKYKPAGFPTFVVVDRYGDKLENLSGYLPGGPEPFIAWISKVGKP